MSRVINPNSPGKTRNQLMKAIAIALRELTARDSIDETTRDLAAFIAAALKSIAAGVEDTVVAWEKRDYWLKADRFRLEWEWAAKIGDEMQRALLNEDWATVSLLCAKLSGHLSAVKIPKRPRIGTPWEGAWDRLKAGA